MTIIDWISNQMLDINIPTVFASIGGSWLFRELIDLWKGRNLQSQKAKIDRELELTKTACQRDIQTHYLQMQLIVTSLYKVYPELHWAFKETEGSVYQLFFHSTGNRDETYRIWCALTKKLAEHSLFLGSPLEKMCIVAKDLLMDGIRSYLSMNDETKNILMRDIHKIIDEIANLMKSRLLDEGVKIPGAFSKINIADPGGASGVVNSSPSKQSEFPNACLTQ